MRARGKELDRTDLGRDIILAERLIEEQETNLTPDRPFTFSISVEEQADPELPAIRQQTELYILGAARSGR